MDMYKTTAPCIYIDEVDLDDLDTYPEYWLKMSAVELRERCAKDMGESLFYMLYHSPSMKHDSQFDRVDKMCREFVEGRMVYYKNTQKNRLWLMKLLYRFEDEVENQC